MILNFYARLFISDTNKSLKLLQAILGREPDYRFTMGDLEITGIGDICLVCGTDHALAPYRDSKGPFIVDNLGATREELIELGATITRDQFQAKTGSVFFARHPDGTEVEYVQWKPDLVERLISH
jgi:hypothetical protein